MNRRAFGQDQEANIVDTLRANGAALVSLVALEEDVVIGHIIYTPLTVGSTVGAALGPMAVLPERQRQGVGRALVEAGTRRLDQSGCPFIVVLGHAHYAADRHGQRVLVLKPLSKARSSISVLLNWTALLPDQGSR